MKKITRTISGITPVALMTAPMGCPGQCVYCPTFSVTPQSYTPDSPAVIRARAYEYDAARQVESRLKTLADMGHLTEKIELIIMGGTFPAAPPEYQYKFIKDAFDALNGVKSGTLEEAQQINQTARHRCTGLCIETRPDFCSQAEINRMLELGCTRVELGVQMLSDSIYETVKRGHTVEDVVKATALLRQNALKVHYHWMPGLPGSSPEEDLRLSKMIFDDPRFRPDGIKLYPTMVVEGTEMEKWFKDGRYRPYGEETMLDLISHIKALIPKYVRISRVLRDIPSKFIVGGLRDSIRDPVRQRMKKMGLQCRCIRCREYGFRLRDKQTIGEPQLTRLEYAASDGKELFLSFEDEFETLFGMIRLRIQSRPVPGLPADTGEKCGLIRELHVFGPQMALKQRDDSAAQHRGYGRTLLKEAERIAREEY
ncbi:MAG TPA: tRNA uridine(34) 5-carboxymethylaminomethyl modification radical SAM/GNAT enzyme Elp3, partial [Dehalococcoidales bacterium]|nr:tRNA uridine(34) 5-carboxymethylaminomethyl modification radical SAM/GNAT enzyme Elp3 [Dehalococcoidales bacterium]